MPPKKLDRFPLCTANEGGSAETIWASIGHGTPSLATRITPIERVSPRVLPEAEIDDNSDQERLIENETDDRETDTDDNHDVDPRAPLRPIILLADVVEQQRATMERQERMIEFLFKQNTELLSRRESTSKNDKFDMTNPRRYCGGPRELDTFLGSLRSNFRTHSHLVSDGDTDKVQYALDHLGSWSNHRNYTLHKTSMIDPITWSQDLLNTNSQCLYNFDLFVSEIRKMYSDKDRKLNAGTRLYLEFRQGHYHPDESVRAYVNRLRQNWREAGWDKEQQKLSCYHMIWAGLKPELHPKVKPFTNEDEMIDSIDELFNRAVDVETQPQKYDTSQQQRQDGETSYKGGRKRGYRPSISESKDAPKEAPKPDKPKPSGGGKQSDLPPAPWVSSEVSEKRKASRKCSRFAGDHISFKCPKFSRATYPDKLTPGDSKDGGNGQIKSQRAFDTQQAKN